MSAITRLVYLPFAAFDATYTEVECIPMRVSRHAADPSRAVVGEIAAMIHGSAPEGRNCMLGLVTGSIPSGVYEELIRLHRDAEGIDLQVLEMGRTGHIGFNEPGCGGASRTRMITLDRVTRSDAASAFFGEENVPGPSRPYGTRIVASLTF
jgi:6-phosphogluconolactonase/glucosamine-6-phosphate isomerase/deaminase